MSLKGFQPSGEHLRRFTVILDHLFNEVLGLAVGVGARPHGMLLIYGEVLGVSIHCGGAAEHQIVHLVSLHHLRHMLMHTNMAHAYS